ncbi:hypothetical protein B0T16DRAFT_395348 [Cercophora newfieldiana]|uniref:Uncharacterized protein n=1 Tax=Cercophora newfieldiana TaxID=92897 RepID=A0AA39XV47_9PEZI|nr:hypothetical protein B0T16DRAFT_395348 [Cercophora newfieldiana]
MASRPLTRNALSISFVARECVRCNKERKRGREEGGDDLVAKKRKLESSEASSPQIKIEPKDESYGIFFDRASSPEIKIEPEYAAPSPEIDFNEEEENEMNRLHHTLFVNVVMAKVNRIEENQVVEEVCDVPLEEHYELEDLDSLLCEALND